jgi:hypothetical protein
MNPTEAAPEAAKTPAPSPAPSAGPPQSGGSRARELVKGVEGYAAQSALLAPGNDGPSGPDKKSGAPARGEQAPVPKAPADSSGALSVQFDRPRPPFKRSFAYGTVEGSVNVSYKGTFGPTEDAGAEPTLTTSWDSADGPKAELTKKLYEDKNAVPDGLAVTEISVTPSASLPLLSADRGSESLAKVGVEGEVKYFIGLGKQHTGFSKVSLTLMELKKGEWSGPSVEMMPSGIREQLEVELTNPKGKVSGEVTLAPKFKLTPDYRQIALRLGLDKAARALAPAAVPLALAAGGVLTWAAYLKSITDYQDDKTFVTQARTGADAFCESYLAGVMGREGEGEAFSLGQQRFGQMLDKFSKDSRIQGLDAKAVRAMLREHLQSQEAAFRKDAFDNLRPKALRAAYGRWAEGKSRDTTGMAARDRFVRAQLGIGLDEKVDGAPVFLAAPVEVAQGAMDEKSNPVGHHMAKVKDMEKASADGIAGRLPGLAAEAQKLGNQLHGWIHQTARPIANRAGAIDRHNAGMALLKRGDGLAAKLGKNPTEADLNSYGANAAQDYGLAAKAFKEGLLFCPPGWPKA